MLSVCHIKKFFCESQVLRDVSFDAKDGELTILVGQNGAGKSTLFNILTGVLPADKGQIVLDNMGLTSLSAMKRARFIAFLAQDPKISSAPSLTVMENCALALLKPQVANLMPALTNGVVAHIKEHLNNLELSYEHHLNKTIGHLSGGQRQIIAFAMATIHQPKLLLLDEPTAALDDHASHTLMRLIKKMIAYWRIPAVMICHDQALNQAYGDQIVALKNGLVTRE